MTDVLATVLRESKNKNETKDCAVLAMSIATDYVYDDVHYVFSLCGRRSRKGTPWHLTEKAAKMLRFTMTDVTRSFKSRTVRTLEREMRGCKGRYLVRVNHHLLSIVDGIVHDWTKGRLHRIISIYRLVESDKEFHLRSKTL